MSEHWSVSASCAQVGDPEIWFPDARTTREWNKAKRICIACPVKDPCLVSALREEAEEQYIYGMRGAKTPKQRRELLTQIFGKVDGGWQYKKRLANMENLVEAMRVLYADGDASRRQAWSTIVASRRAASSKD